MKYLIRTFDLTAEGSLPLTSLTQLGHSRSLPSPSPSPAACTGTFSHPLASLISSCVSPFSPSWRDWELLPLQRSSHLLPMDSRLWNSLSGCRVLSPVQRSRIGPPQPLPSTSRSHTDTPGGICPSPTLPGRPGRWWVGSGSLSGSGGHAGTHEISTLLYLPR